MTATDPAVRAPAPPRVRTALPGAGYALGVLTFINVINYLDRYLIAGILPRIEDSLHIDHAQGGLLQSVFIVVYMLVAPLGGYFGDRYPRRWVLSLSIFIWSIATVGSGLAGSFAVLLLARAIVGIGEAGYGTVSPGLIADFFPLAQRTRALSVFYVAIPVGSALGYVLGGWIGNTWSWHAAFFVGGLPGLLAAVLALRMREPARGATEEGTASSETKMPFMEGLRGLRTNTFYWVSVAGLTLMTFSIGGLAVFMPTFLERERGVPATQAAIVFGALLCVSGLVGTLVGGVLGDRAERKSTTGGLWLSGWGMLLAAPFMVWTAYSGSVPIIYGAAFLAMFLVFLNNGPLNAAIVSAVPPLFRSFAVGLSVLCYHALGDAISPPIIGWLGDRLSLGTAIALNAIPVFLGGLLLVVGARLLHGPPAARVAT
ncbi:MAG: MFS transporter [Myxococcaceae bacterium]|nr:MAG: MFS transporter [Myxococcaceae bacterium]